MYKLVLAIACKFGIIALSMVTNGDADMKPLIVSQSSPVTPAADHNLTQHGCDLLLQLEIENCASRRAIEIAAGNYRVLANSAEKRIYHCTTELVPGKAYVFTDRRDGPLMYHSGRLYNNRNYYLVLQARTVGRFYQTFLQRAAGDNPTWAYPGPRDRWESKARRMISIEEYPEQVDVGYSREARVWHITPIDGGAGAYVLALD